MLVLQHISAMYWLGSILGPSDEITLYAIEMLRSCTE